MNQKKINFKHITLVIKKPILFLMMNQVEFQQHIKLYLLYP